MAVLVRTRDLGETARHLLAVLQRGLGYDLFACVEAAQQPPGDLPEGVGLLRHNAADLAAFGLVEALPEADYRGAELLWYFGDYAWYASATAIPDYDHYLIVDERLAFCRDSPLFIEALVRRLSGDADGAFDLVSTWLDTRSPAWLWHADTAAVFGQVHGMFAPLVALSRRAVAHLFDWRRREAEGDARRLFWEALVPTALMAAGGFRCADVNMLLPGAWSAEHFPSPAPMLLGVLPPLPPTIEMVYPVLAERDYLTWLLEESRASGTLADLVGRLAPGGDLDVSEPARAWFLRAALQGMETAG